MWRLLSFHISQTSLYLLIKLLKPFNCSELRNIQTADIHPPATWSGSRYGRLMATAMFTSSLLEVLPSLQIPCNEIPIQFPICVARMLLPRNIFHPCTCSRATYPQMLMSPTAVLSNEKQKPVIQNAFDVFHRSLSWKLKKINQWASLFAQ